MGPITKKNTHKHHDFQRRIPAENSIEIPTVVWKNRHGVPNEELVKMDRNEENAFSSRD
jgi:hypothetical protein